MKGYFVARGAFLFFNALFLILGCISLGIGVWLYIVRTEYHDLTPPNHSAISAAGLCVSAGFISLVTAFLGCCGAYMQNRRLLIVYFIFAFMIFAIELTVGVLGFLYHDGVSETIRLELKAHLNGPYMNVIAANPEDNHRRTHIMKAWDHMQIELACCGVDNYTDWFSSPGWPYTDRVPKSCCVKNTGELLNNEALLDDQDEIMKESCTESLSVWHQRGCHDAFSKWLIDHMHIVGAVGLVFALTQAIGIISAIIFFWSLVKSERSYRTSGIYYYHRPSDLENDNYG